MRGPPPGRLISGKGGVTMTDRGQNRRIPPLAMMAFLVFMGLGGVSLSRAHGDHDESRHGTAAGDTAFAAPANAFCPVLTGREVDPAVHTTHDGKEIYFCCDRCRKKFLADPTAYLANLSEFADLGPPTRLAGATADATRGTPRVESAQGGTPSAGLLDKLGWFHPLAVHFPIAFLLAAALAEVLSVLAGWRTASRAIPYLLVIAAPSAVLAMLLGFATSTSAGASAGLASAYLTHRTAGIATAALAVLAAVMMHWREDRSRKRRALWFGLILLAAVAVAVAGHFGAVMVHGRGPFLFSPGVSS